MGHLTDMVAKNTYTFIYAIDPYMDIKQTRHLVVCFKLDANREFYGVSQAA